MSEIDARTKAIGIISGGKVQALEDAGLMVVDKQEIDRLKKAKCGVARFLSICSRRQRNLRFLLTRL